MKIRAKRPWLAALLNIILPGLGYIYNGNRKIFGGLLTIGGLLIYGVNKTDFEQLVNNPLAITSGLITIIAFAFDAYSEAKK